LLIAAKRLDNKWNIVLFGPEREISMTGKRKILLARLPSYIVTVIARKQDS
jgi:hypothetical protein